jgi:NADPH:quinone reductase-like Zn-dependent oxidoreductase
MKASLFRQFGDEDVLEYEEVPDLEVRPGHVLIKVLAAGVNRLEHYIREGSVLKDLALPHVLGSDASGEIAAIGDGVKGFRIGERVIPMPGYPLEDRDENFTPMPAAPSYAIGGIFSWGSYAQYMSVPAKWVVKDKTGLSPASIATLPMVLITAVRAVKTVGEVKRGDRVLIHAGAAGTGSMNIQVAHALGAQVAATVQGEQKARFARDLGVEMVIDVEQENFVDKVKEWTDGKGVDVVVDNLGGNVLQDSLKAVRTQGIVVAMGFVAGVEATFHVRDFFFTHKQIRGTLMGDVEDLKWGLEQVKDGKIKPLVDRTLPLEQANVAHQLLATNATAGNLVLLPW